MKINRLLEIIIILLNRGSVTSKELAARFGVSTRTILRDIDVLSSAGVPVVTSQGNGGGVFLMEGYALNKTLISQHESESLIFALKTLQAAKYPEIDMMLDKIGAMLKNSSPADWVHIDFSHWGSKPSENNKFINIKKAILQRKILYFDYVSSKGKSSSRSVEPMQLVFKGQAWYLWGYCKLKGEFRTFRISRIKSLDTKEEVFTRREDKGWQNNKEGQNTHEVVSLRLRFYPQVLYRVYDDFDDEFITNNPDGSCDVTVAFPEDEWVYGYILSFGCFVEVIEPNHIKNIIVDRMKTALGFYQSDLESCNKQRV